MHTCRGFRKLRYASWEVNFPKNIMAFFPENWFSVDSDVGLFMCRFRFEQYTPHIGTIFLFRTFSPDSGPILFLRFGAITTRSIYEIAIYIQLWGEAPYFLRSQNAEFGLEIIGAAGAVFPTFPF